MLVFAPASISTDDAGDADVQAQMPESGDAFVVVHAGGATDSATILAGP